MARTAALLLILFVVVSALIGYGMCQNGTIYNIIKQGGENKQNENGTSETEYLTEESEFIRAG